MGLFRTVTDAVDWALLQRLTGRATSTEQETIQAWTEADERRKDVVDAVERGWQTLDVDLHPRDAQWQQTAWHALDQQRRIREVGSHKQRSPRTFWQVPAAGVMIAAALLVWGIAPHIVSHPPVAPTNYATPTGMRATVTLHDGTRVIMAPVTQMHVSGRVVTLTGAAYFMVPHVTTPFLVRTNKTTVRVLGTGFTVRQYSQESATRVVVTDGKVAVSRTAHAPVVLSAHQAVVVPDSGAIQMAPNVSIADELAWTRGQLVFRDTPFGRVIPELEHTYGLTIHVTDSALTHHTVTASFGNESADDVLSLLAFALNARITRTGVQRTIITFTPQRHAASAPPRLASPLTSEVSHGR